MGTFWYADSGFGMFDTNLRYLQLASEAALAAGQGFALEIQDSGHLQTLYLSPGVALEFQYDAPQPPEIDAALCRTFEGRARAGETLQWYPHGPRADPHRDVEI